MPPSGAIRKERLTSRPCASPLFSAREPIRHHLRASAARSRKAASSGSSASCDKTSFWRARLVEMQLVTSGVSTMSAPLATASSNSLATVARFSAGSSLPVN